MNRPTSRDIRRLRDLARAHLPDDRQLLLKIADHLESTMTPMDAETVDQAVADLYALPGTHILASRRRDKPVSDARAIAMWLLRQKGWTVGELAKRYKKNHASVNYALSKVVKDDMLQQRAHILLWVVFDVHDE